MILFIVLPSFDLVLFLFFLVSCVCVSVSRTNVTVISEDDLIPLYNKDTGWLMLTCVLLWLPRVFTAAMLSRSVRKYLQTNIKLFYWYLFLVQSHSNLPERFVVDGDKQQVALIQHGRRR